MAHLIPDEFDFSAYLRDTEGRAKVRKASDFAADMVRRFAPADPKQRKPEMFSTKLRGRIEFRPGEVTTWAGYNGHKKSMFTGQLALDLRAAPAGADDLARDGPGRHAGPHGAAGFRRGQPGNAKP